MVGPWWQCHLWDPGGYSLIFIQTLHRLEWIGETSLNFGVLRVCPLLPFLLTALVSAIVADVLLNLMVCVRPIFHHVFGETSEGGPLTLLNLSPLLFPNDVFIFEFWPFWFLIFLNCVKELYSVVCAVNPNWLALLWSHLASCPLSSPLLGLLAVVSEASLLCPNCGCPARCSSPVELAQSRPLSFSPLRGILLILNFVLERVSGVCDFLMFLFISLELSLSLAPFSPSCKEGLLSRLSCILEREREVWCVNECGMMEWRDGAWLCCLRVSLVGS